ncbi:hypothetical protein KDX01_04705 [Burkholderia vietnamiensis]|nr:hypothetical protein [Burkholderia vietnamiensis]
MFHRNSMLGRLDLLRALCVPLAALMLAPAATHAAAERVVEPARPPHAAHAAHASPAGAREPSAPARVVGDDPVAIRDALAQRHLASTPVSLGDRVRRLIPGGDKHRANPELAAIGLDRKVTFLVPATYGLRYQTQQRLLTVDVDMVNADGEGRTGILLRKAITGPRGRGLVIAAEAKAKGYIQRIDIIELDPGKGGKTTVRGRVRLSSAAYAQTHGEFAIALSGRLVQPYLTEHVEHAEPTDDEPTDITTHTSRLYLDIDTISLVNPASGAVLSKNLSLSK